MRIKDQYEAFLNLEPEINKMLKNLDFVKTKELILWLSKSDSYQKLKGQENSLIMLDFFCGTWLEEKKQLAELGIEEDIFWRIQSLKDVRKKYLAIKFGMLRMEISMSDEYYEQVIDTIIDNRISGIAIGRMIISETKEKESNAVKIAKRLKERGQMITAMMLLGYMDKNYRNSEKILLELADCWIWGQQWEQALECLKKIENPDIQIQELINELGKSI